MLVILKRLLWDENYLSQQVRALVGLLGMALITGAVTLDWLSESFGRAGWWLGILLTACAWWVRAGERNPQAPP